MNVKADLVGRAVIGFAAAMRAIVAFEMPGVGSVAPGAGQVAARQAQESNGPPRARPFALQRGEDFRIAGRLCRKGQAHEVSPQMLHGWNAWNTVLRTKTLPMRTGSAKQRKPADRRVFDFVILPPCHSFAAVGKVDCTRSP